MKVVLDANVFVSAAINVGPSYQVVQKWLDGGSFEIVMCPELVGEVTEVLTARPRIRRWIELSDAHAFLEIILIMADLVPDPIEVSREIRDEGDNYLVALAQLNNADFIVTGDNDLLQWAEQNPPAITPARFLALLFN